MEELFKKRLPEDVVFYHIYLPVAMLDKANIELILEDYVEKCTAFILKETSNYIWQNECFNLHIDSVENLPCLSGATNFADSVDDEWFIVYLLQKLTQEFPGLIASVSDTDGQFLLIEAAEHIPKWLSSDTCDNRVFFANGSLHILSKPEMPGQISFSPVVCPTLYEALRLITSFSSETLASVDIRKCISEKISGFPLRAFENIQLTNVYIPKSLVYILDQTPNLVSHCVQSFYLRDPLDLRACRIFKFMLPDERVWCQVPMTRLHYAQLMQQNFIPDKRSGYQKSCILSPTEQKGTDLGMKLAHGCEIFLSRFKHTLSLKCDAKTAFNEQKFFHFIESLKGIDYFGNEREGSREYQRLFNQAQNFYMVNMEKCNENSESVPVSLTHKTLKLLQALGQNVDDLNVEQIPPLQNLEIKSDISDLPSESSDDWMYLDEHDISMIADKIDKGFSSLHQKTDQFQTTQHNQLGKQLEQTVQKVNKFVNEQSDFSGIEVNDDQSIKFDSEDFLSSLEKLLQINPSTGVNVANDASEELSDEFLSSDEENEVLSDPLASNKVAEFHEYLDCMDNELAKTAVGQSFVSRHIEHGSMKANKNNSKLNVNADVNLLENFRTGRNEERISSGPISNILNTIGADLPE